MCAEYIRCRQRKAVTEAASTRLPQRSGISGSRTAIDAAVLIVAGYKPMLV
jgi:hypothetical protein